MEGRLSKLWLVGLRYDGCQIKVGEQKLDFTVLGDDDIKVPANALYSLRNGGGKGVFLQSVFQPLDPLCSWKNDENKISHFFHNTAGKPVQYTFHIVEEWQVSPNKKLMIGISVCPKISQRERNPDKDSLIELDYILYSKLILMPSDFDIFQLPLWDESVKESLPLDEWKQILKRETDIDYYTLHNKSDYIQLLDENGLDKHTISIMKQLNVAEGNMSGYFKGATDNTGIFHNQIIPTINDKIEEINHNYTPSIITTSFLETLKIAKELPLLLLTIRSIEELSEFTLPLRDMYQNAIVLSEHTILYEQKGQEIDCLLQKMHKFKTAFKSTKEDEFNNLSKKIEQLEWQRENLRYVEELKKQDLLDDLYNNLSVSIDKLSTELKNTSDKSKTAKLNVLLKKAFEYQLKIQQIRDSIAILERDIDAGEIHEQIECIKEYFKNIWDSISLDWQQKLTQHYRFQLSHTAKIDSIVNTISAEEKLHREIEYSIKRLNERKDNHLEKQKTIVQRFGENTLVFLDEVIVDFANHINTKNNALTNIKVSIEDKYIEIEKINNEMGIWANKIENQEETIKQLTDYLIPQITKENEIREVSSILLKRNVSELYTRTDFESLKCNLISLMEETEEELKRYNISLFQLEIEMDLIKEGKEKNLYIPNKDLMRLKKILDEKQIKNMYGTEFLKECTSDERRFQLNRNPSLPFSIIIFEENFENIDLSFLEDEHFRSMIILVDMLKANKLNVFDTINPSILKVTEINFIPKDYTFILSSDEYELQNQILKSEKKLDGLIFDIDDLKVKLSKLNETKNSIDILLSKKLHRELENDIMSSKQLLEDVRAKKLALQYKLVETRKVLSTLKQNQQNLEAEIKVKENEINALTEWKKECIAFSQNVLDLKEFESNLTQSNEKLSELKNSLKDFRNQHNSNENAFSQWKNLAEKDFKDLKALLGNITFPLPIVSNDFAQDSYLDMASYGHSLSREAYNKLTSYKDLQDRKGNRDLRIGRSLSELARETDELIKIENALGGLDCQQWQDKEEPVEDLTVLVKIDEDLDQKFEAIKHDLDILNIKIEENCKQRTETSLAITNIIDELSDRYPEYGAVKLEIEDTNQEKQKILLSRQSLIDTQKELRDSLAILRKELSELDMLLSYFNQLHIEPSEEICILTEDDKINLQQSPSDFYWSWLAQFEKAFKELDSHNKELLNNINAIKDFIDSNVNLPLTYKTNLAYFLTKIRDMDYTQAIQCIDSYNTWAEHSLQQENEQKKKAEDAVNFWSERASRRVLEICQNIEDMERKMKIKNWNGDLFPLIQMEKSYSFPRKVEDIRFLIKQFCTDMITEILKNNPNIDDITPKYLSKYINMSQIVLKVLGEYPRLKIYIPSIDGPLLRGGPDSSCYKEWETINHGSSTSSTKSGGQTLLAQFIVLAMLMRQRADENSWLFLVSDNPFGTMSAPELVEAVFSLLELLKIQWLVVAPPITSVHITSKFNTVYQMDVEPVDGEVKLINKLVKKNRKFLRPISIINDKKEQA